MVVLDIGGDVGALVVSAPANLAGAEIEICPSGARDRTPDEGAGWWHGRWRSHDHDDATRAHRHPDAPAWPHVAVVARPTGSGKQYCAVYPGLRRGNYELWLRPDNPTALTVTVLGAEVTWADWPAVARE
jgi:hypothetical protein